MTIDITNWAESIMSVDLETGDVETKTPEKVARKRKPRETGGGRGSGKTPATAAGAAPRDPAKAGAIEYGEQLANQIKGRFRFAPGSGWRRYTGSHWEEATVHHLIHEIVEMLGWYAPIVIQRDGTAGAKEIASASTGSGIAGMIKVAQGWPGVLTDDNAFDRPRSPDRPDDPHLFPCKNAITIELFDSGKWSVRKSSPDDLLTRVGCEYRPDDEAKFTGQMFRKYQPDLEIQAYIMRIMAGTLRGVQIQKLFVWHGETAGNGKGTMQGVFSEVFGGYARTIPVQALMRSSNSNEYRDELAQLKGIRLVFTDEPEEGARFAPGFVSRLTGGSEMSARGMHAKSITFTPTWSLMMLANKRPGWGDHSGLERRYNEVAWDYLITRGKEDERIKDRMRAEAPGVLNRILEHWPSFCESGINVPDVVKQQSEEGIRASDAFSRFVEECTIKAPGRRTQAQALYNKYKEWCDNQTERPESMTRFSGKLKRTCGIESIRSNGIWFLDIEITD